MRRHRNFLPNHCFHLISRIAHRSFFLNGEERTRFVDRLWRVAEFSGVRVLAYCLMANHFHILVYIPECVELSNEMLLSRIRALYSGGRLEKILGEWKLLSQHPETGQLERFKRRFTARMGDASMFMKTLKQNSSISFNVRRLHAGTMWESRFRVRMIAPDEKAVLMNIAGYIDRNPVKAKLVGWPDEYEWCSFAAACNGDERCRDGYRFIYSFGEVGWDRIREEHERSIGLVLKELADGEESVHSGNAKDSSDMIAARRTKLRELEEWEKVSKLPWRVPRIVEKGSDKVAYDLLRMLNDGDRMPAELRKALGIASANYFTATNLSPMKAKGLIAVSKACDEFSPKKTYRITPEGRRLVK